MRRYAFLCAFPARGLVEDHATGQPVTYARRPTPRQHERCDPYGIATIVRVHIHEVGSLAGDGGRQTYEVLS